MKHLLIIISILISGCATNITMTGKPYTPVSPLSVKILFKEKPKCIYEELGFITTPYAWDQNRAINLAREKAAEVGADYMTIETLFKNQLNDTSISAIAYKCGVVNRDQVNTTPEQ